MRAHLDRTDVVTPALPGFAAPLPLGFDATKDAYVDWLVGTIEEIGEPVDLVGHDWGSLLVQRVVSIRPDLIRTWAAGSGTVDRDYVWHDLAQMWQTPEVGEQVMDAMSGDATMKDCILRLYRSAAPGFDDWHDAVSAITRPGLVLWGADDPYVTAAFGERLAQRTGARIVMFADSGHWWPVTKPAEVATALEALWSSASS